MTIKSSRSVFYLYVCTEYLQVSSCHRDSKSSDGTHEHVQRGLRDRIRRPRLAVAYPNAPRELETSTIVFFSLFSTRGR